MVVPCTQRRSSCTKTLQLYRDAPAIQRHSRDTRALQLYRDVSARQVPGTKVAAGDKMGPASTSSQIDRRRVHLDFGPDSNRRYLLSDIRPCLAIRPCPNSIACVQTSYKTMVIYSRFYGISSLPFVAIEVFCDGLTPAKGLRLRLRLDYPPSRPTALPLFSLFDQAQCPLFLSRL
jgi:hypothetical protein